MKPNNSNLLNNQHSLKVQGDFRVNCLNFNLILLPPPFLELPLRVLVRKTMLADAYTRKVGLLSGCVGLAHLFAKE